MAFIQIKEHWNKFLSVKDIKWKNNNKNFKKSDSPLGE
jgi:hypothetical protein